MLRHIFVLLLFLMVVARAELTCSGKQIKWKACHIPSLSVPLHDVARPFLIFFFFSYWIYLFILEGLVISKIHLSIFSIKTVTLLVFFSPNRSPKRPHQRREHFKPIKLQDAPLTDLTETSSKRGIG